MLNMKKSQSASKIYFGPRQRQESKTRRAVLSCTVDANTKQNRKVSYNSALLKRAEYGHVSCINFNQT